MKLEEITKLQDGDGHWYWIPNEMVSGFNEARSKLDGLDYMDDPDAFDHFNDSYGKYLTGGDPDIKPDIFNEMNKQFEYRGFNFNIKVELNTKNGLYGERWNTITTKCADVDNYYKKEDVNDKFLVMCVQDCERIAKKYVDEKLDGKPSLKDVLSELGFK